jgi:hypothetical protein
MARMLGVKQKMRTAKEEPILYSDDAFAPLDPDRSMERIGGGFETEVYRTDDRRYVVKVKHHLGSDLATALADVQAMRAAAEGFAACLGPEHSIPNEYVLARDSAGRVQVLVLQPFVSNAHPLNTIDFMDLTPEQRTHVADQLQQIIWRSLDYYRETGLMPDLYGLASASSAERARLSRPHMLPWHLWSFLVRRNLLRSHNLLLTDAPELRVVLVDYDLVRWHAIIRRIYFAARWLLGWRDHLLIARMRRTGNAVGSRSRTHSPAE